MKSGLLLALLVFVLPPLYAQAQFSLQPETAPGYALPGVFIGTWGSATQCAEVQTTNGVDARLSAYAISSEWIRQGNVYCYMTWRAVELTPRGHEVHALAQCGEDSLREYRVVLRLAQSRLRIEWSSDFITPPLRACGRD